MRRKRAKTAPSRLAAIVVCVLLAVAVLWGGGSLLARVAHYGEHSTVGERPPEELETPGQEQMQPVQNEPQSGLIPGLAVNSYDASAFYEEDGFLRYSGDRTGRVGIDVSSHQQQIDWQAVKDDGVEFAMIRVGYRGYTEGEIQPDAYFEQNIQQAQAAGLDVGVYFFSQALNAEEALEEAQFVLDAIEDYTLQYPVIFDWEDIEAEARTDGMDSIILSGCAYAFCNAIEQAGYRAGIYFNQRFGYEEFDLLKLQDYVFWLAEYNPTPSFLYDFEMWQYANDGTVDGISTAVDLNLSFYEMDDTGERRQ